MTALSTPVVKKFCELCDWTHQIWLTRKHLFDENPSFQLLKNPYYEHFFYRLSVVTQEYFLLQVAKLHDPPVQNGRINLTIDYIIEYGQWDPKTTAELIQLKNAMLKLAEPIRAARNKILSHNDLYIILEDKTLGTFEPGMDVQYFISLKEFANLVHEKVTCEPFPFDDLVINDIGFFMSCFERGITT